MSKGYSLHIGVNKVDQSHYLGLQDLKAAVQDAKDYLQIAQEIFNYEKSDLLLDREANTHNVKTKLSEYADLTEAGDLFFLSYSGHGSLVEDPNFRIKGDEEYDQTWCLYDRQLLDDEIFEALKKFKAGVRILVVSDSCHSGTVTRALSPQSRSMGASLAKEEDDFTEHMKDFLLKEGWRSKEVPESKARSINEKHADLYFTLQDKYKRNIKNDGVKASVKLFAACQDNQVTFDGDHNGRFTGVIKQVILSNQWKELNSPQLLIDHLRKAYAYPTPNFFEYGASNLAFDYNFPFVVDAKMPTDLVAKPDPKVNPIAPGSKNQGNTQAASSSLDQNLIKLRLAFPSSYLLKELALKVCPDGLLYLKPLNQLSGKVCFAYFRPTPSKNLWDYVHEIALKADQIGIMVEVEPAEEKATPLIEEKPLSRAAGAGHDYMPMWPPISNDGNKQLGWHLGAEYSQLGPARDEMWEKIKSGELTDEVRIAHIDTGWMPEHRALKPNKNILTKWARSFIDGEEFENGNAVDYDKIHPVEQQMHGIGTLGIISAWKLDPKWTFGQDIGYIGAAPFLKTIPIRVTESVIILNPDNIADAIDYAIKTECEVITMSLGGKPNKRLAKAVNRAYEKGITFVSAAGNSMVKGASRVGPRTLIYPARYERVIAACGVAQNHYPYDFEAQKMATQSSTRGMTTDAMQGNWGPEKYMKNAIAAYTPNVPWLAHDEKYPVKRNGGGTSSATPQVATAAALWILKNKKRLAELGYAGTWKQVEAVRYALYSTAKPGPFPEWSKYYGQGIIQAQSALAIPVPEEELLEEAPLAKSTWAGLGETFGLLFNRKRSHLDAAGPSQEASLQAELISLLQETELGQDLLEKIQDQPANKELQSALQQWVLQHPNASEPLKIALA